MKSSFIYSGQETIVEASNIGQESKSDSNVVERRVYNVSCPALVVYKPKKAVKTDTAIIICPGGALAFLSIDQEGVELAKYFAEKGITTFILKYRLMPVELANIDDGFTKVFMANANKVLPYATSDLLNALEYIKQNAQPYKINKNKIGIIGFSAGGSVTINAVYQATIKNRPNFISLVYPWMIVVKKQSPPLYKPPLFLVCSDDDPLELSASSADLYLDWNKEKISSELHIYANGGHGYGIFKKNYLSDDWIDRFENWLKMHQFL